MAEIPPDLPDHFSLIPRAIPVRSRLLCLLLLRSGYCPERQDGPLPEELVLELSIEDSRGPEWMRACVGPGIA